MQPAQQQQPSATTIQQPYSKSSQPTYAPTPKTKILAIVLAFFLGCWGAHRLYLNDNKTIGLLMLIAGFLGFVLFLPWIITGIIAIVDIIRYAAMSDAEFNTRFNTPQ